MDNLFEAKLLTSLSSLVGEPALILTISLQFCFLTIAEMYSEALQGHLSLVMPLGLHTKQSQQR